MLKKHGIIVYMSKIIVTGGAGFIGSSLVDRLIALGHKVVVIDDLSSGKKEYLHPRATFYRHSICAASLGDIFKKERPDFVYHLAAQIDVRRSMSDPLLDNDINVRGAWRVLESCRLSGVKKIIFASTGGAVYGDIKEMPTPESCPPYPLSFYGIHKLVMEKYLHCYFYNYGLNYSILRFANVYGPRQFKGGEAGVIAIFIDNAVRGLESRQYGDGRQTRDFVYIDDVVEALCLAKDKTYRGEINIGTGQESSLLDVRRAIEGAMGAPIKILKCPAKPGEQRRSCLDPSRAKKVLHWQPRTFLTAGVKQTIIWAKSLKISAPKSKQIKNRLLKK